MLSACRCNLPLQGSTTPIWQPITQQVGHETASRSTEQCPAQIPLHKHPAAPSKFDSATVLSQCLREPQTLPDRSDTDENCVRERENRQKCRPVFQPGLISANSRNTVCGSYNDEPLRSWPRTQQHYKSTVDADSSQTALPNAKPKRPKPGNRGAATMTFPEQQGRADALRIQNAARQPLVAGAAEKPLPTTQRRSRMSFENRTSEPSGKKLFREVRPDL
jgi:hypothetical protein